MRPWNFLNIEIFIAAQVGALFIIVVMKLSDLCCTCGDAKNRLMDSIVFFLMSVWICMSICGFVHPDLTFENEEVERPVREPEEDKSLG